MTTDWTTELKGSGACAQVSGLDLHHEIHGAGRPLILLHGGLGSGELLGSILAQLSHRHQGGHGSRIAAAAA